MLTVVSKPKISLTFIIIANLLAGCNQNPSFVAVPPPAPEPAACKPVTIIEPRECPVTVCPKPEVVEKVVTKEVKVEVPAKKGGPLDLPIIGEREYVRIEPANIELEARVDTGAETSSIHAENIQLVERDSKRYVQFELQDKHNQPIQMERRLKRKVLIKQHDDESERRMVVKLWVTLGEVRELVEFTLTDRDNFDYPVLLGRNFLTDIAIVDVSRKHIVELKPKELADNAQTP